MDKTICKKCGVELNEAQDNFGTRTVDGKRYFRHLCKSCWTEYSTKHRSQPASQKRYRKRLAQVNAQREAGSSRLIAAECRKWDKKHGFVPDQLLTKDFVQRQLDRGCEYCGATSDEVRLGLDRINNLLGHDVDNVNPACTRCNLTRGDMPYVAWLEVAPGMRRAREKKLFGTWVPGNRRNAKTIIAELNATLPEGSGFRTEREWNDVDYAGRILGDKSFGT